jgi:hypothetical protein
MRAAIFCAALALAPGVAHAKDPRTDGHWRSIFNGRNLDGWVPKVNHRPAGENWRDTFIVKGGVLKVSYAQYGHFNDEFSHLVYSPIRCRSRLSCWAAHRARRGRRAMCARLERR